jgi:hypothetical protein
MWSRTKSFFKSSETIFWARVQAVLGLLALAVTFVDPQLIAPVLDPKYLPWFLLANGIGTEYLRRRRAGDL